MRHRIAIGNQAWNPPHGSPAGSSGPQSLPVRISIRSIEPPFTGAERGDPKGPAGGFQANGYEQSAKHDSLAVPLCFKHPLQSLRSLPRKLLAVSGQLLILQLFVV
jgi:hypothetical protein